MQALLDELNPIIESRPGRDQRKFSAGAMSWMCDSATSNSGKRQQLASIHHSRSHLDLT
jgi:hypothetical protein